MKIIINPQYQSAQSFISQLPEIFQNKGELIFKKRNEVKRFYTDHGEWIVKRYKTPNIFQQLAYTFWRKSKAERAFLYAEKLLSLGIDTPIGIAYLEKRKGIWFDDSYFISMACPYPPVFQLLIEKPDFDKELADALTLFFVKLHQKGILHGDLNLDNILYHIDDKCEYHFSVIDTNRTLFKSKPTPKECLDNLKRVTHRRDLLQYIVEKYAEIRRWDATNCTQQVIKALDKFEKKKRLKRKLRNKK